MRFNRQCKKKSCSSVQRFGFTYIELLVSLLIGSLLMVGIATALSSGFGADEPIQSKNEINSQARFALQRMQHAVSQSTWLLVPFADRASTGGWKENERDVLAVTLPHSIDSDGDGVADADNDGDGFFDEDLPEDTSNDGVSGLYGIDDDGNGSVDDGVAANDDEYDVFSSPAYTNEDAIDGSDGDPIPDGTVDEDPPADMNKDTCPGICSVDDDGDGATDEGNPEDDDEDGQDDEDWYDAVVFYVNGSDLIERTPVPWDEDGSGGPVDGRDFVEQTIAENVTLFKVVREPITNERTQLVSLTLQLSASNGQSVQLNTQVRLGGAL